MWNMDLLAGYTLSERVERELNRRMAREGGASGGGVEVDVPSPVMEERDGSELEAEERAFERLPLTETVSPLATNTEASGDIASPRENEPSRSTENTASPEQNEPSPPSEDVAPPQKREPSPPSNIVASIEETAPSLPLESVLTPSDNESSPPLETIAPPSEPQTSLQPEDFATPEAKESSLSSPVASPKGKEPSRPSGNVAPHRKIEPSQPLELVASPKDDKPSTPLENVASTPESGLPIPLEDVALPDEIKPSLAPGHDVQPKATMPSEDIVFPRERHSSPPSKAVSSSKELEPSTLLMPGPHTSSTKASPTPKALQQPPGNVAKAGPNVNQPQPDKLKLSPPPPPRPESLPRPDPIKDRPAGQKISIVDTATSPITPRPSLRRPPPPPPVPPKDVSPSKRPVGRPPSAAPSLPSRRPAAPPLPMRKPPPSPTSRESPSRSSGFEDLVPQSQKPVPPPLFSRDQIENRPVSSTLTRSKNAVGSSLFEQSQTPPRTKPIQPPLPTRRPPAPPSHQSSSSSGSNDLVSPSRSYRPSPPPPPAPAPLFSRPPLFSGTQSDPNGVNLNFNRHLSSTSIATVTSTTSASDASSMFDQPSRSQGSQSTIAPLPNSTPTPTPMRRIPLAGAGEWKRFDRSPHRPRGPRPPPPPSRARTWAKVAAGQMDNDGQRPGNDRTHSTGSLVIDTHTHPLDEDGGSSVRSPNRSISEQNLHSAGATRGARARAARSPEYTDLDVFVSRLEGSGREYEVCPS